MSQSRPEAAETESERPGYAPQLDETQRKQAEEEQSLDAKTTYEVVRQEGERELERSTAALAWSGLAAGLARTDVAVREWTGLLAYWLTGRIPELFPGPR